MGSADGDQVIVIQTSLANLSVVNLTEIDMTPETVVVDQLILVLALGALLEVEIVGVGLAESNYRLFTETIHIHVAVLTSGTLFGRDVDGGAVGVAGLRNANLEIDAQNKVVVASLALELVIQSVHCLVEFTARHIEGSGDEIFPLVVGREETHLVILREHTDWLVSVVASVTARNGHNVVVEDVVVGIAGVVVGLVEEGEVFVTKRGSDFLTLIVLVQGEAVVTQDATDRVLGNLRVGKAKRIIFIGNTSVVVHIESLIDIVPVGHPGEPVFTFGTSIEPVI